MFDRRLIENFDWGFLVVIGLISSLGLVVLYSAVTAGYDGESLHYLFKRQGLWMGTGFAIMMASLVIDFRNLDKLNLFFYGIL